MREGWTYKKLGEVCEIFGRIGFRGYTKNDFVNSSSEGAISLSPSNIVNGEMDFEKCSYITWDKYEESPEIKIFPGDILLVKTASVGKTAIVKSLPHKATINPQFVVLKEINILNYYLSYYLKSNVAQSYIWSIAKGVAAKTVSQKELAEMSLPIPPLSEQEAIVSELDKINELISLKKAQLSDLDNLAQSIFYEMFGDPVENEKGWEVKKLGEVCDVRDGTHDSPKYLVKSDYILITSKNIKEDGIDYSDANYISKEDYENINKRSYVDNGDIIMAMIGTIGKPIIVHKEDINFCIKNVALIKFHNSKGVINIFVNALLNNTMFTKYLCSLNKGGTQKFIALGTIRKLKIPLPPLSLQQSFAAKIEAIEAQKAQISATIKDLETMLASRMQYWFE